METKITTIIFDTELTAREIPGFRGAVMTAVPDEEIYHNHDANRSFRYRYPLIQYKRIDGLAALVGIGEGAESLEKNWHTGQEFRFDIAGNEKSVKGIRKSTSFFSPQFCDEDNCREYIIHNWLPLNQKNYSIYKEKHDVAHQIEMLNSLLVGNILSLYKGLGYWFDAEVKARICDIIHTRAVCFKGIRMMGFDIRITTNISLPENCGIGKGVSKGFGTIFNPYEKRNPVP